MLGPVAHPGRVLIIRPSALGDVARSVPALVSLRAAWPEARIDWLVQDGFADVIRYHPALHEVVSFPRRRFGQMLVRPSVAHETWRWMRALRHRRYDVVFDLQGLLRSGLMARMTGAPRRVGLADARELGWLGCNVRHRVDPSLHAVDRMLALVAAEGIPVVRDMRLHPGPADLAWADELFSRHELHDQPFAVLAPTARWLCKCWPLERYVELARRLLDTGIAGQRVIIVAAPQERAYLQPLLTALDAADDARSERRNSRVIFPATTVGQMMALLSSASLVVCNDSAALHVAAAFDRPLVAVFGPTDPRLQGPYRRPETVVRPPGAEHWSPIRHRRQRDDQSLIAQVNVEAVWARVAEQLAAHQ